jgi:hypothetical protein
MATVNFSVPDAIKESFNETFGDENKSAIIARLMREAVEERHRQRRRSAVIEALIELRGQQPSVSDEEIRRTRAEIRP